MSGGVTTVKRVITSLTPLQPATPIANPTTLHALEFPLPQGGSLVCLTPKESIPAYENLYEKYGITCTTNTTVGYCGDDGIYRFPEYAARSDPDNADIAFAIELRLRKVRNQAPNSRKAAYQALRTIAKDVPQSMHQVFWEEATRILLTTPKSKTAHLNVKHAFTTSRRHATCTDIAKTTAVLAEFAAHHDIVDPNIITDHIKTTIIPARDVPAGLNLLVAPATGGLPINSDAVILMRQLGHHAALTREEADAQLVAALAHTTDGFRSLPRRFFTTMDGQALSWAIAANPHAQQRILDRRPRHLGLKRYLRLVRDSGAWNLLAKTPGKPAYFLCREICRTVVWFVCGSD